MNNTQNNRTLYPKNSSGGGGKMKLKKNALGYSTKQKAIETIISIRKRTFNAQRNIINTLYQRAKYHPNQTPGMRSAMRIFNRWLTIAKEKNS